MVFRACCLRLKGLGQGVLGLILGFTSTKSGEISGLLFSKQDAEALRLRDILLIRKVYTILIPMPLAHRQTTHLDVNSFPTVRATSRSS